MAKKRWKGGAALVAQVDTLTVGGTPQLAPPNGPALGSTPGGTLGATTYFVKLTYVNPVGETTPSPEDSLAVAANNLLTVASPGPSTNATGYNVYVGTAAGLETLQTATPRPIGTNYTEPLTGLVVGGNPPASNTAGMTYTATIGLNSLIYTAVAGDTNSTVAANFAALLSATAFGEFNGLLWAASTNVITATAGTPGTPFTLTATATGTATLTDATVTPNGSPNDLGNPKNFDVGAVPVNGDDLFIDSTGYDIWWGLNQSGVTLNSLTISSTFQPGPAGTATIGLPELNTTGTPYVDYRATFLQIGATTCTIGDGLGDGSGRIKIDFGAVQTACVVHSTGAPIDANLEALLLKGTHAANVFTLVGGSVAVAPFGDDLSAAATLYCGTSRAGAPTLRTGTNCTVTTCNMEDGSVLLGAAPTTLNKVGGDLTILGGNMTALNERGGSTAYLGTGTITNLLVGDGGSVDFSQDVRGRTVTGCTLYAGATLNDPFRSVTFTNPLTLSQCGLPDVTLDVGKNITLGVTDL